jgi:carotenoid cleavage dioxygenase
MTGGMPIRWSDDYPARFGVMPREGGDGDVQWFDVDPCYVFHTLNAYDDGDTVVVHGCRLREIWRDSANIGDPDNVADAEMPHLWEWRLDRSTGKVTERQLDDRASEFPRVPDAAVGLRSRYGYAMGMAAGGDELGNGEIFKFDLADGAARTAHVFRAGQTPGEPVFVPAEGARREDDGYLMTFVHDATTDTSHLTVLDASDIAAEPIAEIQLPRRVPAGFHGSWIAD